MTTESRVKAIEQEAEGGASKRSRDRILFYSEAWGRGGIENFIRSIIPALLESDYGVDIYSVWDWRDIDDSDLDALGVKRYCLFRGYRPGQATRLVRGVKGFSRLLESGRYSAVWINTMNGAGLLYAWAAYRAGIAVRIVHSHNADVGDGAKALKRLISRGATFLLARYSTVNIACSEDAGRHLFGVRPFRVIYNGVDVDRFRFDARQRLLLRQELGVSDSTTLIGNIGRISSQKNPLFQVKVFSEYKKIDNGSVYLMLGGLDMAPEVKSLAESLGVSDSVIIRGPVKDASSYYSALDAFLMPSLYEGFGYVKLEAQCAGLPVVASDGLPKEADVTDLVTRCSLSAGADEWAKELFNCLHRDKKTARESYADEMGEKGCSLTSCRSSVLKLLDGIPRKVQPSHIYRVLRVKK